jgi:1-acyl-sn-glycerol-3-phosphate acyltransferase
LLGFGTLEIVVEFHAPTTLAECGSRKTLARHCEDQVAAGMARALSGRHEVQPSLPPRLPGRRAEPANAPAAAMG